MKKCIFRRMFALALFTALLTSMLVVCVVHQGFYLDMQQRTRTEAQMLAQGFRLSGLDFLHSGTGSDRVTVVNGAGVVQYDSTRDALALENHSDRPEIAAVLRGAASAEDERLSQTLGQQTFYFAVRVDEDTILRVAAHTLSLFRSFEDLIPASLGLLFIVALLAFVLARHMSATITTPLNRLNLEHPEQESTYEELAPLLSRIAQQKKSLDEQILKLGEKQEEFRALSENMNEGLLLLDHNAAILTLNQSALRQLGGQSARDYTGCHFLQLCRDYVLQEIIETGLHGARANGILQHDGRKYRYFASPLHGEGKNQGVLLLSLDVTEREQADQLRREFSANVSHELKTPLTSISGYAEMLAGGMVRDEDIAGFGGRIFKEAGRLLALIEDIIKLSGLDEGVAQSPPEKIDLQMLARQCAEHLAQIADKRTVQIAVEGEPTMLYAVRSQLEELLYNLAENAIKYNHIGGSVTIDTRTVQGQPTLTVRDTGIGIPQGMTARVFERFFRVDKSRSKETGGTGLGLSIVKHIALRYHAQLELESEEGVGTCIRVCFPPAASI